MSKRTHTMTMTPEFADRLRAEAVLDAQAPGGILLRFDRVRRGDYTAHHGTFAARVRRSSAGAGYVYDVTEAGQPLTSGSTRTLAEAQVAVRRAVNARVVPPESPSEGLVLRSVRVPQSTWEAAQAAAAARGESVSEVIRRALEEYAGGRS